MALHSWILAHYHAQCNLSRSVYYPVFWKLLMALDSIHSLATVWVKVTCYHVEFGKYTEYGNASVPCLYELWNI